MRVVTSDRVMCCQCSVRSCHRRNRQRLLQGIFIPRSLYMRVGSVQKLKTIVLRPLQLIPLRDVNGQVAITPAAIIVFRPQQSQSVSQAFPARFSAVITPRQCFVATNFAACAFLSGTYAKTRRAQNSRLQVQQPCLAFCIIYVSDLSTLLRQ